MLYFVVFATDFFIFYMYYELEKSIFLLLIFFSYVIILFGIFVNNIISLKEVKNEI